MTCVLVVIDAQNEFSAGGKRPVVDHGQALAAIRRRVAEARSAGRPIAWIRHHNRPDESPAFEPGSWGAELSDGLGPDPARGQEETLLEKETSGAFAGTALDGWLTSHGSREILLVGFFTFGCLSTTAREALDRGYAVAIDPDGTASIGLTHELLGRLEAAVIRQSALLQLNQMGAAITPWPSTNRIQAKE
jgi:nicotinamidase-related amidase